ncbi:MAG TPA: hypothetical protein VGB45_06590 [Abditibacterium sp.]|jgi:hypothetical protein
MKFTNILAGATLFAASFGLVAVVSAQPRGNNRAQGAGGGALPLPEGVRRVVSIDAYNVLLAEYERDGQRGMSPIIVRHIYSGGVARLFGGTSIPTEQFISPGATGGAGGAQGGRQGIGGNVGGFGATGVGGNQGGAQGGIGGLGGVNTGGGAQGTTGGFGGGFGGFLMRPVPQPQQLKAQRPTARKSPNDELDELFDETLDETMEERN